MRYKACEGTLQVKQHTYKITDHLISSTNFLGLSESNIPRVSHKGTLILYLCFYLPYMLPTLLVSQVGDFTR